jgi:hypothetical protein
MKDPATPGGGVERVDIRGKVDGIQLEAESPTPAPADTTPGGGGAAR